MQRYWSAPATTLGLPRLAAIYERGFYERITWRGAELTEVLNELAALEQHWSRMALSPEQATDLAGRAMTMRAAVGLAQHHAGFVAIS